MYTADEIVRAVLAAGGQDEIFASRMERAAQDDWMLRFLGQFVYECGMEVSQQALQHAAELVIEALSQ